MLERRNASLAILRVHPLELLGGKLLNFGLHNLDDGFIHGEVGPIWLEADHAQRCRRLKRAVDMVVLTCALGRIQVRRHASDWVGLGQKELVVCFGGKCAIDSSFILGSWNENS